MSTSHQTPVVSSTPLPLPTHFSHAQHSFTVKKWKPPLSFLSYSSQSPSPPLYYCLPPRPPSKGCTPLSRVFPHRSIKWTPLSRSLIESPPPLSVYDPSQPQSFFSQCFTNLGLIGRGSFGEVFKVRHSLLSILPIHNVSGGYTGHLCVTSATILVGKLV